MSKLTQLAQELALEYVKANSTTADCTSPEIFSKQYLDAYRRILDYLQMNAPREML